jgi:hypothetical protein
VLGHGRSRPPTHTLTSLSPTDPLHTLPLTTLLALCRAVRSMASTTILMAKISNVLLLRTTEPLTVRAAAHFSVMPSHRGKVRQHERGALHAMDPRLYACVVPFVARGRSAAYLHS